MVLSVSGLKKTFGDVKAVDDVSFNIKSGEILAFLGPNGAGKTTTIQMIAGLIEPDVGTVSVCGFIPSDAYSMIGSVLEGSRNLQLALSAIANLEYFGVLKGMSVTAARKHGFQLLEMFRLTHKADTYVEDLSGGMKSKVSIAVAMIHSPKLLLLDEPTNELDVEASMEVRKMLRGLTDQGYSILLTTHFLHEAEEIADRVVIINEGKVIEQGLLKDVKKKFSPDTFEIRFESLLTDELIAKIEPYGVRVEGNVVVIKNCTNLLYQILNEVRPTPIVEVRAGGANLTDIFLQLVRDV